MDPITIYLERIAGFPVRVFTGYLDSSPYYQLFPGTITLQASCTLKRLLHSWFDPALPFVIAFFEKYGWLNTGQGSIINPNAIGGPTNLTKGGQLQDSSFGKLLWATLFEIGDWRDDNIYIESLPSGLAQRLTQLMSSMEKAEQQASSEFTTFMSTVVGAGSQGSGGNTTTTGAGGLWAVLASHETKGANTGHCPGPPVNGVTGSGAANYTELSTNAQWNGTNGTALGPGFTDACNTPLIITNPANSKSVTATLDDVGAGSTGQHATVNGTSINFPAIGIYDNTIGALGLDPSAGSWLVHIQLPQGSSMTLSPPAGMGVQLASTPTTTGQGSGTGSPAGSLTTTGYVNPIPSGASPSRVDQGVDYGGTGTLLAIGNCKIVAVNTGAANIFGVGTGNIVYQLLDGSEANALVYYSEYILPTTNCKVGATLKAGDPVATMNGGIEVGWAAPGTSGANVLGGGYGTYSQFKGGGGFDNTHSTAAGVNFNNFLTSLGAPGGSVVTPITGTFSGAAITGGTSPTTTSGNTTSTNSAEAFVAELQFPSIQDQVTAIALGSEHKGLMHDQNLLPFIQQLTQASCRSFQSLPNGDFYGFYPDYFGEFENNKPYWWIDDIEILDGGINLSDDGLATHVFAVGANTWPVNNELLNMLFSAGNVNVFNAFLSTTSTAKGSNPFINGRISGNKNTGMQSVMSSQEAINFIKRYGARPLVQDYPMVHSNLFEMLLAYQQFMYAWSTQFQSPFTFTFMPELYPGGKVGFPNHGLQMYINSVTHTWDYAEAGFTTTAELTAPSVMVDQNGQSVDPTKFDLPPNMVRAMVEPVADVQQVIANATSIERAFINIGKALQGTPAGGFRG